MYDGFNFHMNMIGALQKFSDNRSRTEKEESGTSAHNQP